MAMQVVNPATGEPGRSYEETSAADVDATLTRVQIAWESWRNTSFMERADKMRAAAEALMDNRRDYARLMAEEMGKPVTAGVGEIEKCAWVCEHYAEHAEAYLAPDEFESDGTVAYAVCRPLGPVLAVMPWNFPFWQVFRFAAPGLMAGNACVLKNASNVPGCALAIEAVFREAAFPEVFRTLLIGSDRVGSVIDDKRIAAVTLTGSTPAGRAVASAAGNALKKTVLELGGSDPYLILEDADVKAAAGMCATSRLINGGQSCIAAKRFIVVNDVREAFEEALVEQMRAAVIGDPLEDATTLGPIARVDLRDDLHRQVSESIAKGARCLLGGDVPDKPGAWYPPTVLTDVGPGMPARDEEVFGPVAAVIAVADEAEAIRVANETPFGLGAAVFTEDSARGERIASDELDAGCCFVNSFVKSDPRLPFGGIKASGYGRELSRAGIREFVNLKTVYVS